MSHFASIPENYSNLSELESTLKQTLRYISEHETEILKYAEQGNSFDNFCCIWDTIFHNNWNDALESFLKCLNHIFKILLSPIGRQQGVYLARTILRDYLKHLYRVISSMHSIHSSLALDLMTVLCDFGPGILADIYTHFDFTLTVLSKITSSKKKNLRRSFVTFIINLLEKSNPSGRVLLIGVKDLLSSIFIDIDRDIGSMVVFILDGFEKSIVQDGSILRSMKLNLFNQKVFENLLKLYESDLLDDNCIDRVHSFMVNLCKSICFPDRGWYGHETMPGKLHNVHLLNVISLIRLKNEKLKELVMEILRASPELIGSYWQVSHLSLDPKCSYKWIIDMNMACSVLLMPLPEIVDGKLPDVKVAIEYIYPSIFSKSIISKGLQYPQFLVRLGTLKMLESILLKIEKCFESSEGSLDRMNNVIRQRLPEIQLLVSCYQTFAAQSMEEKQVLMPVLLKTIGLMNKLFPEISYDAQFDFGKMVPLPNEWMEMSAKWRAAMLYMFEITRINWIHNLTRLLEIYYHDATNVSLKKLVIKALVESIMVPPSFALVLVESIPLSYNDTSVISFIKNVCVATEKKDQDGSFVGNLLLQYPKVLNGAKTLPRMKFLVSLFVYRFLLSLYWISQDKISFLQSIQLVPQGDEMVKLFHSWVISMIQENPLIQLNEINYFEKLELEDVAFCQLQCVNEKFNNQFLSVHFGRCFDFLEIEDDSILDGILWHSHSLLKKSCYQSTYHLMACLCCLENMKDLELKTKLSRFFMDELLKMDKKDDYFSCALVLMLDSTHSYLNSSIFKDIIQIAKRDENLFKATFSILKYMYADSDIQFVLSTLSAPLCCYLLEHIGSTSKTFSVGLEKMKNILEISSDYLLEKIICDNPILETSVQIWREESFYKIPSVVCLLIQRFGSKIKMKTKKLLKLAKKCQDPKLAFDVIMFAKENNVKSKYYEQILNMALALVNDNQLATDEDYGVLGTLIPYFALKLDTKCQREWFITSVCIKQLIPHYHRSLLATFPHKHTEWTHQEVESLCEFVSRCDKMQEECIFSLVRKLYYRTGKNLSLMSDCVRKLMSQPLTPAIASSLYKCVSLEPVLLKQEDFDKLMSQYDGSIEYHCLLEIMTIIEKQGYEYGLKGFFLLDESLNLVNSSMISDTIQHMDAAKLYQTMNNFPWDIEMQDYGMIKNIYDPCYILRIVYHLLSRFSDQIDFHVIFEMNLAGICVCALSSKDVSMRNIGYEVVGRLLSVMRSRRVWLKQKNQVLLVLEALKNSIEYVSLHVPFHVTLFAANALYFMSRPDHLLYPLFNEYLLKKPKISFDDIPLYDLSQQWCLKYLNIIVRDENVALMRKKLIYDLKICFSNTLNDPKIRNLALKVLTSASRNKEVVEMLYARNDFFQWIYSECIRLQSVGHEFLLEPLFCWASLCNEVIPSEHGTVTLKLMKQ